MRTALCLAFGLLAAPAFAADGIPTEAARSVFGEAQTICERDAGRLWGASLCLPIMLVDPESRMMATNVQDGGHLLQARDGVFVGTLPLDANIANTAMEWSGTRWTQVMWPLPGDPGRRGVLLAHELFHNLQPGLRIGLKHGGDNAHLAGFEGRYWLQLEWRALARALQAGDDGEGREAVLDALAFRAERQRSFPDAKGNEDALELNEGLAEYTGVMLAGTNAAERRAAALHDLDVHVADASFVRSFAYATGPAYGILLDRYRPGWREELGGDEDASLSDLLAGVVGFRRDDAARRVAATAPVYDEAQALRSAETLREQARLEQLARNRKRFVDGPVLVLALALDRVGVEFDPRVLQPLDDVGTVYPALRVTDDWGILEADGGALMKKDWSAVVVNAPVAGEAPALHGDGWTLALSPGWKLSPGERPGDFVLVKAAP